MAILVVIFAPKGIVGLWNDWIAGAGCDREATVSNRRG